MKSIPFIVLLFLILMACTKPSPEFGADISQAQDQIIKGKAIFKEQCSSCHEFNSNAIGPNLSGLTRNVESSWIRDFIKNPQALLDAEDPRALGLLEKYRTVMPGLDGLSEDGINSILSYLHTFEFVIPDTDPDSLVNLIEAGIPDSGIVLDLEFFSQLPPSDTIPALAKMTKMEPLPQSNRLFINDQRIGIYELVEAEPRLYLDLKTARPKMVSKPGWGTGLGSFAFHPDFLQNGLFYTAHTEPGGTASSDFGYTDSLDVFMQWVLTEWKATDPSARQFKGSSREIFRIDNASQAHGMQELTFNPNAKKNESDYGLLYIGFGDAGTAEKGFANIANHQGSGIYSSILRIDPLGNNGKNGQYGIPENNPFAQIEGKAGEIYAYGFRNPNRIFWTEEGTMYATDIGQHSIEELNRIEPGKFYGWPVREGTFVINPYGSFRQVFPLPKDDAKLGVTYPLIQLEHDELAAIFAGYIMPYGPIKEKLIFGDILSGRLFFADLDQKPKPEVQSLKVRFEGRVMTLEELVGGRVDLKFGMDAEKNVYIMSKNQGNIYKILDSQ
ncbi:PQQ-dependent sugar dehydrogenase [Algoriphagus namhaensis]|uniref:PQQ-dependent sugar dehydrogenase n=1 Tax=Algoriphagus namhaensis TaxID=915353 RepID=A0ABV8AT46_9BACT